MADEETVVIESKATPEQQAAAEKLGWIPPPRFKGDIAGFVDAEEYIKRGETVLPIVKEHNRRLEKELNAVKSANAETEKKLVKAMTLLEEIEERHSVETQKAVEAARKQLKIDLAAASEAGDHAAVAELTDQMTQLKSAETKAAKPEEKAPPAFVPDADLSTWLADHQWYGKDRRKTALALGIAQELREGGETSTGLAFYKIVAAEVTKTLGDKGEAPVDKVEGGRNGSETETRAAGKKSYMHLSAEAKAACDADTKARVGPDKRYKDAAAWRARYAELYFGQES
ncbi:MAG: hypothetical protein U1E51_21815 [Candidatus Binatia bacterium]|nr:hypothetical protein [Candidatus Binatia bacterium]